MYTNLCIPGCLEVSYVYQPLYSRLSRGQLCIPTSVNTTSSCLHVVSLNLVNMNNNKTNKFPSFTSNSGVDKNSEELVNSILGLSINNDTEKIVIAKGKQDHYKSRSD